MLVRVLTVLLLLLGIGFAPALAEERELGTSFFDDFDSLDLARWFASDGWNNGNHQSCGWGFPAIPRPIGPIAAGNCKAGPGSAMALMKPGSRPRPRRRG